MAPTSAARSAIVGPVVDRGRLGREVDRRRLDARRLAQEPFDPIDARRARHPLDGERQLGGGRGRRCARHTPWEYIIRVPVRHSPDAGSGRHPNLVPGPVGTVPCRSHERRRSSRSSGGRPRRRSRRACVAGSEVRSSRPPRHRRTILGWRICVPPCPRSRRCWPAGRSPLALRFDLDDRPAWDRRVLEAVAAIPYGRTASYGDDRPTDRCATGRAGGRWRRRAEPDQPADPVPSRDRRRRHDRRLRR